ncbi:MAG: rhodanese-like domain-containing protein [Firmicutes bacterium]|nr:rhodanese-like domain-containing protein [Bacillota bacterium]
MPETMRLLQLFRHPKDLRDLAPDEVWALQASPQTVLIDVRTLREYRSGHIPGAVFLPMGHEAEIMRRWKPSTPIVLVCKTGHRSQAVAAVLIQKGYRSVSHLKGGMDAYKRAGYPVSHEDGE